jgi:hypothetical protein
MQGTIGSAPRDHIRIRTPEIPPTHIRPTYKRGQIDVDFLICTPLFLFLLLDLLQMWLCQQSDRHMIPYGMARDSDAPGLQSRPHCVV